ncbi:MAG: IS1595 family transposase, partial [Betaproteobacteria bacterium]
FAKYAHRYLAEAHDRVNRRVNLASILARLLRAATLTPPRPAALIRLAEECR